MCQLHHIGLVEFWSPVFGICYLQTMNSLSSGNFFPLLFGFNFFAFGTLEQAVATDFEKEVRPILKEKCYKCHNGPKAKKGLDFSDDATIKKFIGDGEAEANPIVPGKPNNSLLIHKVSLPHDDPDAMPPPRRGATPLTQGEIDVIAKWITEGAKIEGGPAATEPAKPVMAKADPSKMLDWTNSAGKTIKAGFVKLEGEAVVLRLESGMDVPYPLNQLHEDSQKQAKDLAPQ